MCCAASSGAYLPCAFPKARHAAFSRAAVRVPQGTPGVVQTPAFPAPRPGAQARRRRPAATPGGYGAKASSLPSSLRGEVVTTLYVVGPATRKPAWFVGFPSPARKDRKVPESARGRRGGFPSHSAKQIDPDVRPCLQGGIGCPVSGARGHFAMRD